MRAPVNERYELYGNMKQQFKYLGENPFGLAMALAAKKYVCKPNDRIGSDREAGQTCSACPNLTGFGAPPGSTASRVFRPHTDEFLSQCFVSYFRLFGCLVFSCL